MPDKNFAVPEHLHASEVDDDPRSPRSGRITSQTFTDFFAKWYAGKVKDLKAGLAESTSTIDAKIKQAGGRRRRAVSLDAGRRGRGSGPGPAGARSPPRQERRAGDDGSRSSPS